MDEHSKRPCTTEVTLQRGVSDEKTIPVPYKINNYSLLVNPFNVNKLLAKVLENKPQSNINFNRLLKSMKRIEEETILSLQTIKVSLPLEVNEILKNISLVEKSISSSASIVGAIPAKLSLQEITRCDVKIIRKSEEIIKNALQRTNNNINEIMEFVSAAALSAVEQLINSRRYPPTGVLCEMSKIEEMVEENLQHTRKIVTSTRNFLIKVMDMAYDMEKIHSLHYLKWIVYNVKCILEERKESARSEAQSLNHPFSKDLEHINKIDDDIKQAVNQIEISQEEYRVVVEKALIHIRSVIENLITTTMTSLENLTRDVLMNLKKTVEDLNEIVLDHAGVPPTSWETLMLTSSIKIIFDTQKGCKLLATTSKKFIKDIVESSVCCFQKIENAAILNLHNIENAVERMRENKNITLDNIEITI